MTTTDFGPWPARLAWTPLGVLVILVLILVPRPAPAHAAGTPWMGAGPGVIQVVSDGAGATDPQFTYSLDPAGFSTQTWMFSTTATATGPVTLDYTYSGSHAWYQVTVFLQAFAGASDHTLVDEGPVDCCAAPSDHFEYSGSVTLDVNAGDAYGFRFGGSNYDYNNFLQGSLTVHVAAAPTLFVVDSAGDTADPAPGDGECGSGVEACTLRAAIAEANALGGPLTITFHLPSGATIEVGSPLPAITAPLVIDGTTQPGGHASLHGSPPAEQGLLITGDAATLRGLEVYGFPGPGIAVDGSNNRIESNLIHDNGGPGVAVTGGAGNAIQGNSLYADGGLGIDLGNDGITRNDALDADTGPNGLQNFPVLQRAIPEANGTLIQGILNSAANKQYRVDFFASDSCSDSYYGEGKTVLSPSATVTTNALGFVIFEGVVADRLADGAAVTAVATDPATGDTSEFSRCVNVSTNNDSWPNAYRVPMTAGAGGSATGSASQFIDRPGGSRWYRFAVPPGAKVTVNLSNVPADYNLVLFRDIAKTYDSLEQPQNLTDLAQVNAEFAPEMFTPEMFTPEMFTPEMFTPEMFTPEMFTPEMFTPEMFTPEMFTPEMFTPEMFTPEMFTPEMFTPEMFTPEMFTPEMFTPEMFTPEMFTPEMFTPDQRYYSSAQRQSVVAVSTFAGTAPKTVTANSWNETGDFYVLVSGRNGAYDPNGSFQLTVSVTGSQCAALPTLEVHPHVTDTGPGSLQALILADYSRMGDADLTALKAKLAALASATSGQVVDVSMFPEIQQANGDADTNYNCVFAKNVVAYGIKDIVDAFRAANPGLKYIVLVGNDNVIPFFRYPDGALLGNESGYEPPVRDATASEASLKLGYFLSQDAYGATTEIDRRNGSIPVPGLAVGRLVERPDEMVTVIDAFLNAGGAAPAPANALVTGYDFLADVAGAVRDELAAGLGPNGGVATLISSSTTAPANGWTAGELNSALLGSGRHDLIFLAGHFSTFSALAADYSTRLLASDVANSSVDMTKSIVFSNGCHSGYVTVNEHGVPSVTIEPDWGQAFARKGATLIAGTGYQYGDTDYVEYSERLYLDFSRELRGGSGPVAVGDALVRAKQDYLSSTAMMRPIHEKALFEVALYGLPMLTVNMPGARYNPAAGGSVVSGTTSVTTNPGATLGLQTADVTISAPLTRVDRPLTSVTGGTVAASYWAPPGNTLVINPNEPILPLLSNNVNTSGLMMRGAGFRGGAYTDVPGVTPLTGAATTEIRGIHAPFVSNVFYPIVPWDANYFDVLAKTAGAGVTRFNVTPVQYRSNGPAATSGTIRKYDSMAFRLFYSANTEAYTNDAAGVTNIPALSSPPVIARVTSVANGGVVSFAVSVTGDPSAGIQAVWATYTSAAAPFASQWQSLDLTQDPSESTLWSGTLDLAGTNPADFRFMVQAANGVGLVSLNTNRGEYFTPGIDPGQPTNPPGSTLPPAAPAALAILSAPPSGSYGTSANFTVRLTSNGAPLPGQSLELGLTTQRQTAVTDGNGQASVDITLIGTPGDDIFRASFAGTQEYAAASVAAPFAVTPIATTLTVKTTTSTFSASSGGADLAVALADATGRPLPQKTVLVVIEDAAGAVVNAQPIITDLYGNAVLKTVSIAAGNYIARAYFGQVVTVDGQSIDLTNPRYDASTASTPFTANTPPTPDAGGPYDLYEGDASTTLNATATDPDAGQALRYFWDMNGNGQYDTEGASVTFDATQVDGPSIVTVGLKVCDPVDCATTTAQVTVLPGYLRYCLYSGGKLSADKNTALTGCALGAEENISIDQSSRVDGPIDARGGGVTLGKNATVSGWIKAADDVTLQQSSTAGATVQSGGRATLQKSALVKGDLLASSGVSIDQSARVLGTVNGSAPAPVSARLTPLTLALTAGTQDVAVAKDASKTLDPGSYGNLSLQDGATLMLAAGHYAFQSINVQKGARLVLDLANVAGSSVLVDVVGQANFDSDVSVHVVDGGPAQVLFRVQGNKVQMAQGGAYDGTYLAPNADFQLNKSVVITGSIYGMKISLDQDVRVTGQPSIAAIRALLAGGSLGR